MIPEIGIRSEFKRSLLETTQTMACVNCGSVTVAPQPDSEAWNWCYRCVTPVLAGQAPEGARIVNITHWGVENDTRIGQLMGM